jgi:serine/threonine protein kinase
MPSYFCCFSDPADSREERTLDEQCPECRRPYGFPLDHAPTEISEYRVVGALGRGFYAATYIAERGALGRKYVLKVVPTSIYDFFGKDFQEECRLHLDVAEHSEHLVDIIDMLGPVGVEFGDVTIDCHVAVLEYVEGPKLLDFAEDPAQPATAIAQVSIDLLQLLRELEAKERYHNDLHDENIIVQRLGAGSRRADAVHEGVRAVAIDLGSLAEASKSADRLGDLQ